jgi:hypothetical protein
VKSFRSSGLFFACQMLIVAFFAIVSGFKNLARFIFTKHKTNWMEERFGILWVALRIAVFSVNNLFYDAQVFTIHEFFCGGR